MNVLAIDPGRSVGWARSTGQCGELALGKYVDEGEAVAVFQRWLADQLSEDKPDTLVIERAFFTARIRNADFTAALVRIAHATAWMHEVPRAELTADKIRLEVFGQSRGLDDKARVQRIRAMGWNVTSDHVADAVALLTAHLKLQAERVAA